MPKRIVVFVLLAAVIVTGASATAPILPDQFGRWQADGPAKTLQLQDLGNNWAQGTNGDKVVKEAGLTRIEQRTYRNGNDTATFRVFTLRDPSSAYEFYTFLLAPGMRNIGIGEDSALSQYDARFLVGNLVVQTSLSPNTKPETLTEILKPLKAAADPRLAGACAEVAARAAAHFEKSDAIMDSAPRAAVRAPRLMAAAYRSIHDRMLADGFAPPRRRAKASRPRILAALLRYGVL